MYLGITPLFPCDCAGICETWLAMSNHMAPHYSSAAANVADHPEWLRIREACQYSRLSKPKLYELINRGLIKTVSLRERGMVRGTRLVSFDSLKAFLESRASGGEAKTSTAPAAASSAPRKSARANQRSRR